MPRKARERHSINVYAGDTIELEMRGGLLKRWAVMEYFEKDHGQNAIRVKDLASGCVSVELIANVLIGVLQGSLTIRRGAASAMLTTPLGEPTAQAQQAVRA